MAERRALPRHRAVRTRRRRRAPVGLALLATGVVVGALAAGPGTWAWWNDVATVQGAGFEAGTLDVTVGGGDQGDPTPFVWGGLAVDDLAPGESLAAALTVSNDGSTPFTLSVTGAGTGALLPHLTVTVVPGGTAANSGSTYPRTGSCSGGTQTYAAGLSATPATVVAGSAPVAPGAGTTLCVVVALPGTTDNGAQGTSATTTFVVTATQVAP